MNSIIQILKITKINHKFNKFKIKKLIYNIINLEIVNNNKISKKN